MLNANADLLVKLKIRHIVCGRSHTLMLTAEGTIYSLGSNEHGKLGIGKTYEDYNFARTPIKVDNFVNVASIAVGEEHSIALTKDFKVYGWGQAEYGAIGMRLSNAKVPNEIKVMPETS